jgi:hypothetical protein
MLLELTRLHRKFQLIFGSQFWTILLITGKDDFGIEEGQSTTELRARQIHYLDSNTIMCCTAGAEGPGDMLTTTFNRVGFQGGLDTVVAHLLHDLSVAHYGKVGKVPQPIQAAFKSWNMISCWWKPSTKISEIRKVLTRPCGLNKTIYYANSNSSNFQGWMEGALQASEAALEAFRSGHLISTAATGKDLKRDIVRRASDTILAARKNSGGAI